jgi:UDP-GlcNAc:undecaprenyl-phosphate GlcNAc-1-phosphate transferase
VYSASVVAFLITAVLLVALRPLANSIGLVDYPGGRKTHNGTIPVVGGIAMLGGLVVATVMGRALGHDALVIVSAAAFIVFIGALDDRFDLAPQLRLFAQAAAAIALIYGTGFVVPDLGDLLGFGTISTGWLALPFTVIACMALINAFNMLDGLDGLAGGCALIALGGLSAIAIATHEPAAAIIACSLFGACCAFLLFNVPVRYNRGFRTFMGDAGSTLVGFVLACVALILIQPSRSDVPPAFILWMVPIPVFELFSSIGRRLVAGVSPLRADNGHFHHRLLQAGFSTRQVFTSYFLLSNAAVAFGVAARWAGISESLMFAMFLLFFGTWVAFVQMAPLISTLFWNRPRRIGENV